jgi:hypothetical protein
VLPRAPLFDPRFELSLHETHGKKNPTRNSSFLVICTK